MDHRRRNGRTSGTGADHEREAAGGARPRASVTDRRSGFAAVWRHARAQHTGDRRSAGGETRKEERAHAPSRAGACVTTQAPGASAGPAHDPYAALDARAREVLDCWFGAPGSP